MDAPRTDGTPETGTLGVGVAVITVSIGVGVAVMTTATGLDVGIGVAVTAGHTQVNNSLHSGFLQRLMPCTVAQTKPDEQSLSPPHDASQTPGCEGGEVGTGVEVGVEVGVAVAVGIGVAVAATAAGGATATAAGFTAACGRKFDSAVFLLLSPLPFFVTSPPAMIGPQ